MQAHKYSKQYTHEYMHVIMIIKRIKHIGWTMWNIMKC